MDAIKFRIDEAAERVRRAHGTPLQRITAAGLSVGYESRRWAGPIGDVHSTRAVLREPRRDAEGSVLDDGPVVAIGDVDGGGGPDNNTEAVAVATENLLSGILPEQVRAAERERQVKPAKSGVHLIDDPIPTKSELLRLIATDEPRPEILRRLRGTHTALWVDPDRT